MSRSRAAGASAALGVLLLAVAFVAKGGNQVSRMAPSEVAIVLLAGVALAVFALRGGSGRVDGAATTALLAALAVLTGLSTAWSISPGDSIEDAARVFAYLAVFGVAVVAAHVRPRAARVVLGGLLVAGVGVCAWALVTRIFPGTLAENVLGARLGEPFGYWNALGGVAVLTLPAALWLGSRRDGALAVTALAYPATGILLLVLLLTQSRGALGAGVLVAILWLVIVPLRLRSLGVLALGALAAAPVAAWALSRDPFTEILQPLSAREDVAPTFGLLVLGLVLVLGVAGLLVESIGRRNTPSLATRRRAGLALAALVAVVALAGLGAVAVSDRGLAGTVSDRFDELTSEESATPRGAARLGSVSSSRAGYWRQAWEVFEEQPLIGRGANSFGTARLLYRRDSREAEQAHGFMAQTLSDLGLLGAVIALALLAAWLAAAGRATGLLPRRGARVPHGSEQAALVALALCAVGFGVHSTIDWTWFVPGPTMAALVAAGFVAGRGALPAVGAPAAPPAPARTGRPGAGRVIAAVAVLVTAVLCAWAVWQPERASRATHRSSELLEAGDTTGAAREAARAREIDPYSPGPLYAQAAVLTHQNSLGLAYRTYEIAVLEHPRDPDPWLRLAAFELDVDLPERALATLEGAARVDPQSARIPRMVESAQLAATPDEGVRLP